ncbi:MAG: hydroxymethylbilane synthase [bacterium]
MSNKTLVTLASRKSPLAIRQAEIIRDQLRTKLKATETLNQYDFEIKTFQTSGDAQQSGALADIGGKGLFTKEIEQALLTGQADIAVHSMKDMPSQSPQGLIIAATPPRDDPRDAFITTHGAQRPEDLPAGALIGTASVRRVAQITQLRPDLLTQPLRGNINRRLEKVAAGDCAATFLAEAGLQRLHMHDIKRVVLEPKEFMPALTQGILCVQIRQGDSTARQLAGLINDPDTELCMTAERQFLARLDGSCRSPMAGLARIIENKLHFNAEILTPDGSTKIADVADVMLGADHAENIALAGQLGQNLAEQIWEKASSDIRSSLALK